MIDAVIFDLDGVLLDSESAWLAAKRAVVDEWGGTWKEEASRAMLGMSAPEWSVYMRDELAIDREPEEIDAEVVKRLLEVYRERLPLLPGAVEAVERLAARWPLGLASSSNLEVIEVVMEAGGFAQVLQDLGLLRGGRRAASRRPTSSSRPRGGWRSTRRVRRDRGLAQRDPGRRTRRA